MTLFKAFPKIERFDSKIKDKEIKHVLESGIKGIKVESTVKLHGTNGAIVYDSKTDTVMAQSRTKILNEYYDNYGFCKWVEARKEELLEVFRHVSYMGSEYRIYIYGEFVGKGIQNKVAVSQLPERQFIAFRYFIEDINGTSGFVVHTDKQSEFVDMLTDIEGIHDIRNFTTFEAHCSNTEEVKEHLEHIKDTVEESCPVGKYLGYEGIGEGVVSKVSILDNEDNYTVFYCKTKGNKHIGEKSLRTYKNKAILDVNEEWQVGLENCITESRLEQFRNTLIGENDEEALTMKHMGQYLKYVLCDISEEERAFLSTLEKDERKFIMGKCTKAAKEYFLKNI